MLLKLLKLVLLLRTGEFRRLTRMIRSHLYSDSLHVGLRRSTAVPFPPPRPRLSLRLREAAPADGELFDPKTRPASDGDPIDAHALLGSGIRTAYVAETKDGEICHLNFVIDASQNDVLAAMYGDLVPPLRSDEALLEAAYTLKRFAGSYSTCCRSSPSVRESRESSGSSPGLRTPKGRCCERSTGPASSGSRRDATRIGSSTGRSASSRSLPQRPTSS